MGGGQDGQGYYDEGSDEFFPHGFPPRPEAFRHLLSTILAKPNAGGEPRPTASAPASLWLLGVGSSALFGAVSLSGNRLRPHASVAGASALGGPWRIRSRL